MPFNRMWKGSPLARSDILVCRIVRLPHGDGLELPAYESAGASGMDLKAAIGAEEQVVLEPGDRRLIPCGIKIQIPEGFEAQVRARSGHALKAGLTMANGIGTIDSDYTGEVGVILINLGKDKIGITRGLRIAQLVVAPVARVLWDEVGSLDDTARGSSGFGSTGVR